MSAIHIYAPAGYYLGQVRRRGARRWRTVTGRRKTMESAMAGATLKMHKHDLRARVLFCTVDGWHEPMVAMESKKV